MNRPVLFIFLIILSCFGCNTPQDNTKQKVDDLSKVVDSLAKKVQTPQSDSVELRIRTLEIKLSTYESFLSNLEGTLSGFGHTVSFLSWVFTVLAVIISAFQFFQFIRAEKNEAKTLRTLSANEKELKSNYDSLLEKQDKNALALLESNRLTIDGLQEKYDQVLKRQEENNRSLIEAVRQNIIETTNFIMSYKDLIRLQKAAEKVHTELEETERKKEAIIHGIVLEQQRMNDKSIRQVFNAFEEKKTSIYSDYWKKSFEDFKIEALSCIRDSKEHSIENNLNGDVYFLIGLHFYLDGQAKDSAIYLQKAIDKAEAFIKGLLSDDEKKCLVPENARDYCTKVGGIDKWQNILEGRSFFFLALNHYRSSDFEIASTNFSKASALMPKEIEYRFWLLQSKYWGNLFIALKDAESEMLMLKRDIDNSRSNIDNYVADVLEIRVFMKLGDFFSPHGDKSKYLSEKDSTKSVNWYKKAYEMTRTLNREFENKHKDYVHIPPMACFAYGRTLQSISSNKGVNEDVDYNLLYKEVVDMYVRIDFGIQNPETKYLMSYILSKCYLELDKKEPARDNIKIAVEQFEEYCSNPKFYGYSPISNLMLTQNELLDEIQSFREQVG